MHIMQKKRLNKMKKRTSYVTKILLPYLQTYTCIRFCENETNVKVIQEVMGHADVSTTMNIYAEVNESTTRESLENL